MKKIKKYLPAIGFLLLVTLLLTACTQSSSVLKAPTSGPYYWVYKWIGLPIEHLMITIQHKIGGTNGPGWAIAIITFVVRLILMPLMLSTQRKSVRQQEKMSRLQPQMKRIQDALKRPGLSQEQQMQISQLQMKIYKENNLSLTGGIGCLPLLLQFPIMIGIYQAIAYSPELSNSSFMGIALGQRSFLLAVLAGLSYLVQGYISLIGLPEEQKKTMQMTLILSPLMTFFFSVTFPAALAFYYLLGGLIAILQQLITTFLIMPRTKKEVDDELKEHPLKEVVSQQVIDKILTTPTASANTSATTTSVHEQKLHQDLRKRNSGKQNHHK